MTDKNLYNKDSIESLDPLSFTRLKPGVYCGDTNYSTQLLVEIISNSIDEFRLGHGDKINVSINNSEITVQDFGQGFIPNEFREDGKSILEAAFSVLNTSGKYREDGTYEGTSLGSFGIGSKITTFLSHWLIVETKRDGKTEKVWFKEGVFEKREKGTCDKSEHGTTVSWLPSEEFFTHTEVEISKIKSLFNTLACLCPGLIINLNYNGTNVVYYSKNGLNDLVTAGVKDTELIQNRFNMNFISGKYKLDMVLTYTSNYSLTLIPYVNTGLTEKGTHITLIKTIFTREFNKFFREKGWLKEKDENLSGDDLQEGMYVVFNVTTPNVSYDAQVKSTVTKIDMLPFTSAIATELYNWMLVNEKEIKLIADKSINARKAREAARKARDAARTGAEKKKQKALKFDSKLADASSKDRKKCEIYITEGDSASGNLKLARDNEYQAVLPIRGKILNVRKASLSDIQKNAEIMTMIDAFGLTVNPKTMKLTFKPDELRYGKIIIESDADVDGAHIKNLFYTFIWTFCPELIEQGYVYAGIPPLYRVTETKDKYVYLKDDKALEEYRAAHPGKKLTLTRMKGLGEMDKDETMILVDPEQRIINQVLVEDAKKADKLFDDLMGTSVTPRKEFIQKHSAEAKYEV